MITFRKKLEELKVDYPFETSVCFKALLAEKKKLAKDIKDLRIELTGVPVQGLFGEDLRKEALDKIKDLENKQKLL